jgi:glycerophosphoryl diester phosphodiesterase
VTLVIAHRGASASRPEQTRAAYEYALEIGADGVECDVRLTADRHVVCVHDPTVDRTSDGHGLVHEFTLDQLRELDFSAENHDHGRGELVTLAELIDLLLGSGRPVVLAIELKHPNPFDLDLERTVLQVLDTAGWDSRTARLGDVTISLMSFNPASVAALAPEVHARHVMLLTAEIELGDITGDVAAAGGGGEDVRAQLQRALEIGREMIDNGIVGGAGPELDLVLGQPESVRGWVQAGLTVRVWTVDTVEAIEACLRVGAQEITTNDPVFVRAYLDQARGR